MGDVHCIRTQYRMDKALLSIIFALLVALAVSSPVRFSEAFESADDLEMTQTAASKKYYGVDKKHPIASWMAVGRADAHKRWLKKKYKWDMDSYKAKCCCKHKCKESWHMLKPFSCSKCPNGYHTVDNDEHSALHEGAESVTAKGKLVLPLDVWHNVCASGHRCS